MPSSLVKSASFMSQEVFLISRNKLQKRVLVFKQIYIVSEEKLELLGVEHSCLQKRVGLGEVTTLKSRKMSITDKLVITMVTQKRSVVALVKEIKCMPFLIFFFFGSFEKYIVIEFFSKALKRFIFRFIQQRFNFYSFSSLQNKIILKISISHQIPQIQLCLKKCKTIGYTGNCASREIRVNFTCDTLGCIRLITTLYFSNCDWRI